MEVTWTEARTGPGWMVPGLTGRKEEEAQERRLRGSSRTDKGQMASWQPGEGGRRDRLTMCYWGQCNGGQELTWHLAMQGSLSDLNESSFNGLLTAGETERGSETWSRYPRRSRQVGSAGSAH